MSYDNTGPQGGGDHSGSGRPGDPGRKANDPRKRKTLLEIMTHFVEGGDAFATQAAGSKDPDFLLRKKIKPIRDPDDVDTAVLKKRTKQKSKGRVGTTTLSNAETLG